MTRRHPALPTILAALVLTVGLQARLELAADSGAVSRYKWSKLTSSLSVELEGEVAFTADDRGIASLSPGGRLEIHERDGFRTRKLTVETGAGGLEYRYRSGGREKPFDADAREWLAELLPRIIRETGIDADARVARILDEAGVDGVLREIERIDASSATRIYCSELLEQGALERTDLARLAAVAADGIASSGELSRFLIDGSGTFLAGGAADAFFEAASTISSSGDHSRVLIHAIRRDRVNRPAAMTELLRSAGGISSSGDKSRVLVAAAGAWIEHAAVRRAFLETADGIASSGDHARALIALLEAPALSPETVAGALRSARGVASSGDKRRVLASAARRFDGDAAVRRAYLDAAEAIASSGDRADTLVGLVETDALDGEGMIALLRSARTISSSGDKTRVLLSAARQVDEEAEVEAYIATAETIASSGDQARALTALTR